MAGDLAAARASYRIAAKTSTNLPELRYPSTKAAQLNDRLQAAGPSRSARRRRTG
jgi:hypothetical protein